MATIDFPSSPTMGQEYPFGDFIYVWDGVKWTTKVIVGSTEESDTRYVNTIGDEMTGDLTVPKVLLSSTQSTEVNSLTRKDYVDGQIATRVSRTGDVITGTITMDGSSLGQSSLKIVNHPFTSGSNAIGIDIYDNAAAVREVGLGSFYNNGVYQFSYVGGGAAPWDSGIEFHPGLMLFNSNPESYVSQGTTGGSLTRKDYVDAVLLVERNRIGELESVISTLTARIEALEAQIASTLVM